MKSGHKNHRIIIVLGVLVIVTAMVFALLVFVPKQSRYELTISVTAKEARFGDVTLVFGFLRQVEYPYVLANVPVSLLVNGNVFNETATSTIGSYIFVLNITQNIPQTSNIQTQASMSGYGKVSSAEVGLTIGTEYKTHSNSGLNVYPDVNDDIYRPHSLVVDSDGTIHNKPPFNYNSWLLYGFAWTAPDEPAQEFFAIQGGVTEGAWWEPGGRNYAAIHFSTTAGVTYDIRASNVSAIKVGNALSPVEGSPNALLPSVWVADSASPLYVIESINLAVEPRQYFIKANNEDDSFSLEIIANGTGYPFWIARRMDNMFVASYPNWFWGAYAQFASFTGTVKIGSARNLTRIEGIIEIDREWHAPVENAPYESELATYYTALAGMQTTKDAMFTMWQSYAPRIGLPMDQSGKLILPDGKTYSLDNYELTYGGDPLAPDWFKIKGTFGNSGFIELDGTVLIKQNLYETSTYGYYQPLVNWTGRITGEGVDMNVRAYGLGECTRHASG
jgi:hypothetical protein